MKGSGKLLEVAILGLLKERPMHGYELKKRLSYMLGHFWTVSYGSLYPALKRLEKSGSIERAYSVKEKTRNRNVFRITGRGEAEFMRLLTEDTSDSSLVDTEKFDLRMALFQYLEPETRLALLETRRRLLEDQVAKFKAYRSNNGDEDRYRKGLMRHKVELARSDIRWLDKLMAHERETIRKRDVGGGEDIEVEEPQRKVQAASGA
ncbi:MAG TPA: PadR family transcriptional regulator [Candidatus Anoxymicrobiaceae bacterium]